MAKAYTTSTASYRVPVVLSFTCPKCGQYGTVNKSLLLSAQATARGYNSAGASLAARQNLASSADSQLSFFVEQLEKGRLDVLLDGEGRSPSKKVICPHCGLRQIMDDGQRKTLYPKAFAGKLIGLFFAVALAMAAALAVFIRLNDGQTRALSGAVLAMEWVCILAVVAAVLINRSRSRKAYSNPALMEKRYRAVLNRRMDAVLMPSIGNTIHIDIHGKKASSGKRK